MTDAPSPAPGVLERTRAFAPALLIGVAAFTIALAGARSIGDIIGPVFLAMVLTVTLHPIRRRLERTRLPAWAASTVMLLIAYLVLVLLTLALVVSVARLADLLPTYADAMHDAVVNAGNTLRDLGVKQSQIDAVTKAADPGQLVGFVVSLLSGTLGVLTDLFFLFTVLLFMAFDTDSTRRSLATLGERFPDPVAALGSFAVGTRSYMGVSAGFGLVVAVVDGVALQLMGIPGAFVWAVLAFVTNFIPNIGFVIGVIPPALIALLEGGPGLMVAVIVVYSVINFLIQSVVQPRVVGDKVGLTPTLTFLSLVFWTFVIGPLGALLAVPLSLLTRALLVEADPRARWALPLISGKPAPPEEAPVAADRTASSEEAAG
jgi:predicted PurR-regulated permease PerM